MRVLAIILLLGVGAMAGYWISQQFRDDPTDKIHVALEKAITQSKFNLVKDNYMEFFYLCEQDKFINNWKALMLVGYTFQYGVDAKNVALERVRRDEKGREHYRVVIKQIETLSSEISFLRAFTLDKALLKNQEAMISQSKDDLIKRREFLADLRLHSKQGADIQQQLVVGINNTVSSLAAALDMEVMVDEVKLPDHPPPIRRISHVHYQCGDINPVTMTNGSGSLDLLLNQY